MSPKRKRHKKPDALPSLIDDLKRKAEFKDLKRAVNAQGEAKMSDAVTDLIRPYRDWATDLNSFRNLIMLACIAWNAANMPAMERPKALLEAVNRSPETAFEEMGELMNFLMELVRRKELLYPDNTRMVINFKVSETKDDFHVAIASTVEKLE